MASIMTGYTEHSVSIWSVIIISSLVRKAREEMERIMLRMRYRADGPECRAELRKREISLYMVQAVVTNMDTAILAATY